MIAQPDYAPLWRWVREREAIRVRKESGAPFPWTDDPILQARRFCNVRREDDRVTVWLRENIRERFRDSPCLWLMCCIARQINWPDTLAELIATKGAWPEDDAFDPYTMCMVMDMRASKGLKVYTGAYTIKAPPTKGTQKPVYTAFTVIGKLWEARDKFAAYLASPARTLRGAHSMLSRYEGWGGTGFMAYQAVVDMRFTEILRGAPDVASWCAAGPGTRHGLNRLYARDLEARISADRALTELRAIFAIAEHETGVAMDFSDVPNIMCEFDKYQRVKAGGVTRAGYVPDRGW